MPLSNRCVYDQMLPAAEGSSGCSQVSKQASREGHTCTFALRLLRQVHNAHASYPIQVPNPL